MNMAAPAERRPYRMRARAESAAATAERILEATMELFFERLGEDFSLDEVADRAGVSARTVIRRFGGKRELMAAATEHGTRRVREQRDEAPAGDVPGAIRVLVEHYEQLGERVLLLLAEEHRRPDLAPVLDHGRGEHTAWCERVFSPALADLGARSRRRRLAQLVAVCDVYTWKLLRHDRGLSRRETELALVELVEALTKEG